MRIDKSQCCSSISPMAVYMASSDYAPNPYTQGLGFFPGFGSLIGALTGKLKSIGESILGGGNSRNLHIEAQNAALSGMEQIAENIDNIGAQGLLTAQLLTDGQNAMRQIHVEFTTYAQQVGTDRAAQGAREIEALAMQFINDWEQAKITYFGTPITVIPAAGIPGVFPSYPSPITPLPGAGGGIDSYLPWIIGGVAAVLVLPKIL